MNNSYKFFANKDCEFYPCHRGIENINCLFCYCPLYLVSNCPGNPKYITVNGKKIKDCSLCLLPHKPENYEMVIKRLSSE